MTEEEILEICKFIVYHGSFDGAYHKQWVLDQTLRMLLKDHYDAFIDEMNGDSKYERWDEGCE